MNNKQYGELVNQEQYPISNRVPIDPPFVDDRGIIQNLWLANSGSITLITSKKGAVRSNHHHEDWHSMYIVSGCIEYYEREINQIASNIPQIIKQGEMIFSQPHMVHKVIFLEDTVIIVINGGTRNHENYENSVVRMEY